MPLQPRLKSLLSTLKKEWFLFGMISAVVFASLLPDWGKSGGYLHGDRVANIGIAIVFFLHGLGISPKSLRDGLSRWKVHAFVQLTTFAVFPLVWIAIHALFGSWLPSGLALGFSYLCALPSTISSSVAMTGLARGNVPAAIFNATLSSLLGIVITPLLVVGFANAGGHWLSFQETVINIARLLLLPLIVGQLSRPLLYDWHHKYKHYTNLLDRWVILTLVYTAFCDSVSSGLWRDSGISILATALFGAGLILLLVLGLSTWLARRLRFPVEDEIAAVFCASKKTMASGVPMAKLLFGAHPSLGLILLPVMLYHQLQLFACSMLANRYAQREA